MFDPGGSQGHLRGCLFSGTETKSEQNSMLDPGGSQGRLRACPFWETLYVLGRLVAICSVFSGWKEVRGISFYRARYKQLDRCFSAATEFKTSCRRGRLEAIGAEETNGGHAVNGGSRL